MVMALVVLPRIDPRLVRFSVVSRRRDEGSLGAWTVDSVAADALVAFNAGQFARAARRGGGWWMRGRSSSRPV